MYLLMQLIMRSLPKLPIFDGCAFKEFLVAPFSMLVVASPFSPRSAFVLVIRLRFVEIVPVVVGFRLGKWERSQRVEDGAMQRGRKGRRVSLLRLPELCFPRLRGGRNSNLLEP